MARTTKPLTDTDCRNAKPREKDFSLFDGGGLFLLVKATGSKSWRFKFTKPSGKPGLTAFGDYPALSLSDARAKRDEARAQLASGIDPILHKQQAKLAAAEAAENSFEAVAREWHAKVLRAGKWGEHHAARVLRRLETNLFPTLGRYPIDTLKTATLLHPLRAIEAKGTLSLAEDVTQYVAAIMRHAVQTGRISHNPGQDLRGAIATPKTTHRPALPLERLPELLRRIESSAGPIMSRHAARFAMLTAARESEFMFARWGEFDLTRGIWTIPPERDEIEGVAYSGRGEKMRRERLVYLTRQTLALLHDVRALSSKEEFVFAGRIHGKPISSGTVNRLLRTIGYDTKADICLHGFRTMVISSLNESGLWSRDAIERHVGHDDQDKVRAAYMHKAQYLEERQRMLQWWADYLDANGGEYIAPHDFAEHGGNVVPLHKGKAA
ncbi:integrase [Jeongeupia sp. HS-3]|uniref:tyrosine-type recombinase/integrase n=1 Tax=Jeongeupia sp. HS-3 TaxID=1009682 RepID=UPI0018A505E5|nr:integrase arm-type DNA-binding domain-containing protein [Jeongeupia sp. HS-3]BCL76447.1 integrase [Jeongeupia sp. HS-3]